MICLIPLVDMIEIKPLILRKWVQSHVGAIPIEPCLSFIKNQVEIYVMCNYFNKIFRPNLKKILNLLPIKSGHTLMLMPSDKLPVYA